MAKATEAQIKSVKEAMAAGKTPDAAVRINFGDREPIQKVDAVEPQGAVSLNGKTKAELQQIAADGGVELNGAETNAEIVAAIEAARSGE